MTTHTKKEKCGLFVLTSEDPFAKLICLSVLSKYVSLTSKDFKPHLQSWSLYTLYTAVCWGLCSLHILRPLICWGHIRLREDGFQTDANRYIALFWVNNFFWGGGGGSQAKGFCVEGGGGGRQISRTHDYNLCWWIKIRVSGTTNMYTCTSLTIEVWHNLTQAVCVDFSSSSLDHTGFMNPSSSRKNHLSKL